MKTTRNSPRGTEGESRRQAVLRLHRLTERELIAPSISTYANARRIQRMAESCAPPVPVCRSWRLHHQAKDSKHGTPL